MDGFKLFRVLGQEAREQLNAVRSDLKADERSKWIKGKQEALKRKALRKRHYERETVIAKSKGATMTPGELYDLEREIIEASW